MGISVWSYEDLESNPERHAPDRNPRIDCDMCDESYSWKDEWEWKITTPEDPFWCESCWGGLRERAETERRKAQNKTLDCWG